LPTSSARGGYFVRRLLAVLAICFITALLIWSNHSKNSLEESEAKYKEISQIPIGLEVIHSPNPVGAHRDGRSGQRFTWVFKTSVQSLGEPVTISEFGGFSWQRGHWIFSNFTKKPFTAEDFEEWYSCPGARILPNQTYSDPNNWAGDDSLEPSRTLWYFIGVTQEGKKVRGEAVMETSAEVTD
jgi:hypothetical protein